LFGAGTGLLILFGFSLPPILRLKRLPPLRVLRRDQEPLPSSARLVYGLAGITLTVLMWRYTRDWTSTATVLGVGGLLMAGFAAAGWSLLALTRRLIPHVPLAARLGLQHLTRRPRLGISQILAFSITLAAMQVILLVRTELIQEWQKQLPVDAPNHFALNLFDADLEPFREFLQGENIRRSEIYPIVRGRLTAVNGRDVSEITHNDSRVEGAINRELSLTWGAVLPADNRIITGQWHDQSEVPGVSMEKELAERLGVKPGDRLTFNIGGQALSMDVTSTRSVRWDSMRPNFFMIFAPGLLEAYPHTWLTSFYIPAGQKMLVTRLAKAFPGMTLLDVGKLISQFQSILRQVTLAAEFVLMLALAAGFTVLFATVRATLDERIHEDTLLRVMGANRTLLRRAQWVEFAALGLLSGLLAALVSELIVWIIYDQTFGLTYRFHWEAWLAIPALAVLAVGLSGYWITRRVIHESPMRVLRDL
jgi:putative ABC transport system permease protein